MIEFIFKKFDDLNDWAHKQNLLVHTLVNFAQFASIIILLFGTIFLCLFTLIAIFSQFGPGFSIIGIIILVLFFVTLSHTYESRDKP